MKSHGILSRYMRPGFKEGGDTWWDKTKEYFSDTETYDQKKRKEIDKKWAEKKSEIDDVSQYDTDLYNAINNELKNTVYDSATNPGGGYLENLQQWHELANTGRLEGAEGVKVGPRISNLIKEDVGSMMSLPIGTREVRPGDYDERVLRWDEVESARKNKDFRDDRTRDDYLFDPGEYFRYLDQSKPGYEPSEGEYWADPSWTERENRYINANTPKEYQRLLNRRSWDTPKQMGGMAKELYDFYYNQGSIKKGTEGMTDEEKSQYVQDLDKEAIGSLINNLGGGTKLAAELLLGYGTRMLPIAPGDVKKYWGESEGLFKGENSLLNKVMYDEDRNRAWGLYDNTIAPFMGWDDPEKYPTMADISYIPGWSDLMGGKEGAGTNPYFGYESGFQPNEDLYTEEAYEVSPMMKSMAVMEAIEKETRLNEERISEAIESGMSEEEAYDMYPNTRAEGWTEQIEAGKYPVNIDYSKFNRLNFRRNAPAQLVAIAETFMIPGQAGKIARSVLAGKSLAGAAIAGKGATGLALAGKPMTAATVAGKGLGTKALIGAGVGAGAESLGDKTPEDVDLGEDFFDSSFYGYGS